MLGIARDGSVRFLADYDEPGTVLIKEEVLEEIFPDSLTSKLDPVAKADLDDGLGAIFVLLPTPAALILLRVAENLVRMYYTKTTGKDSQETSLSEIIGELRNSAKAGSAFVGYLDYTREMRNEAQRPDKRFTQEESERILLNVKGLLEEMG